jgi:hypothetical protein
MNTAPSSTLFSSTLFSSTPHSSTLHFTVTTPSDGAPLLLTGRG